MAGCRRLLQIGRHRALFVACRRNATFHRLIERTPDIIPAYRLVEKITNPADVNTSESLAGLEHVLDISWTLESGEVVTGRGSGASKRAAKEAASRALMRSLEVCPKSDRQLVEWAVSSARKQLNASLDVEETVLEEGPNRQYTHIIDWSVQGPQGPLTINTEGTAPNMRDSRQQAMLRLYEKLEPELHGLLEAVPPLPSGGVPRPPKAGLRPYQDRRAGTMVDRATRIASRKDIRMDLDVDHQQGKGSQARLSWQWLERNDATGAMDPRKVEVMGQGESKKLAKGDACEKMMVQTGFLQELSEEQVKRILNLQQACDQRNVSEVLSLYTQLISSTSPLSWDEFVPAAWRMLLAEDRSLELHDMVEQLRQRQQQGQHLPVWLWEQLLDECSAVIRFEGNTARVAMEQVSTLPLDPASFPTEASWRYFQQMRYLLALERQGSFIHGVQLYLHADNENKPPLPQQLELHTHDGGRRLELVGDARVSGEVFSISRGDDDAGRNRLRENDVLLLVPSHKDEDLVGSSSESRLYGEGSHVAVVTSLKPADSINMKYKVTLLTDRSATEGPLATGAKYHSYYIGMEVPAMRMFRALRGLAQPSMPLWQGRLETHVKFSEALRQFLMSPDSEAARLYAKQPVIDPTAVEARAPWASQGLSPDQELAVRTACGQRLTLIQGPPGTGKTHTACAVIKSWCELIDPRVDRILAVADSNVAADNMAERLAHLGVNAVRIGEGGSSTLRSHLLRRFEPEYSRWMEDLEARDFARAKASHHMLQARALREANVCIATCIGSGAELLEHNCPDFRFVIVDECSQAVEAATLVPMSKMCESLVLVGDHKQLPATVLSRLASDAGLSVSLFERLINSGVVEPIMLNEQRRMHSSISEFPNVTFYNGQLQNDVKDSDLPAVAGFPRSAGVESDFRVAFVDLSAEDDSSLRDFESGGFESRRVFSSKNVREAQVVVDLLIKLLEQRSVRSDEIGVLTPYLAQKHELRNEIARRARTCGSGEVADELHNLSVDTIDGYQGMERDLIVFSATRSNRSGALGFLADERRMNVMLTRARRGLIVVGDGGTLGEDHQGRWGDWVSWIASKGNRLSVSQALAMQPEARPAGLEQQASAAQAATPEVATLPVQAPAAPEDNWHEIVSEQHGTYYWNRSTNVTQWERPPVVHQTIRA